MIKIILNVGLNILPYFLWGVDGWQFLAEQLWDFPSVYTSS